MWLEPSMSVTPISSAMSTAVTSSDHAMTDRNRPLGHGMQWDDVETKVQVSGLIRGRPGPFGMTYEMLPN